MGGSTNMGTPKWMVYMENPIKMDDLGYHHFRKPPYIYRNTLEVQVDDFLKAIFRKDGSVLVGI